jgi:lipopolysaccharide transport system ATP-binding protein
MSVLAPDLSVQAVGLGKRYRLGAIIDRDASLAASAARAATAPFRNFRALRSLRHFGEDGENVLWALRDFSFEVRRGEVLGVVGRNGAGKSTLLKVLSRITEPTEGEATLRGRVSSLIEIGTGFHPDLSGRDNIYLKGTMLGMTRREVSARFDEIVEFAEVQQFLDTPVKRYSSGMWVRLAFAIAAHLDPDVLIADEVLAVGDAEFQRRSVGQMRGAAEEHGRSVIFVSHDLSVVGSLCTRAIWLDHGRLRAEGEVDEVLDAYVHSVEHEDATDLEHRTDRTGSGAVRAIGVVVSPRDGAPGKAVQAGCPIDIRIRYEAATGDPVRELGVTVNIETLLREKIASVSTRFTGGSFEVLPAEGVLVCEIQDLDLNEGDYMCTVKLDVAGRNADFIADTVRFRVDPSTFFDGPSRPSVHDGRVLLRHSWGAEA